MPDGDLLTKSTIEDMSVWLSWIGFFREARTGVMVLINHSLADATMLGRDLLCMITPGCETD